jgi:hypothetical protein
MVAMEEEYQIQRLIDRCRRLAREMTDDPTRLALEQLAAEYEAQLPKKRGSFMLGSASPSD